MGFNIASGSTSCDAAINTNQGCLFYLSAKVSTTDAVFVAATLITANSIAPAVTGKWTFAKDASITGLAILDFAGTPWTIGAAATIGFTGVTFRGTAHATTKAFFLAGGFTTSLIFTNCIISSIYCTSATPFTTCTTAPTTGIAVAAASGTGSTTPVDT